jgi:hypothetical protein
MAPFITAAATALSTGQKEDCAKPRKGTNEPRQAVSPPIIVTVEKLGEKWALQ